MVSIIFEYFYNEKKYISYIENGIIKFGCLLKNKIINNLSEKEEFIIKCLYNFIIGDKSKNIKLNSISYKGQEVDVEYNNINNLYYFSKNIDSLFDKSLSDLNYFFNNQVNFLAQDEKKSETKNKFKIIVKIGGILTSVLVSTSIILSTLPIVPNNNFLFKIDYLIDSLYKKLNDKENNENYSYHEIVSVINKNENLTLDEKNFLINGLENEIKENIDYINIDQLKRNLSELKIVYHKNNELMLKDSINGTYTLQGETRNQIDLYGDSIYITNNFKDCDKYTFVHEINHLLNKRQFLYSIPGFLGDSIDIFWFLIGVNKVNVFEEMANELFSREYFNDFSNQYITEGYRNLMPVMYALCEILDEHTLRKFKFDSDYFYIINYLESIGVDKTYAHELYLNLELINNNVGTEENYKKVYNIIKYCYNCKYDKDLESDLIIMSYFYDTKFVSEDFNKKYKEYLNTKNVIFKIIPKGYISKQYKSKCSNVKILTNYESIIIDDSNRFINDLGKTK